MEQEQTPQQVQPEDTETIQIEERDAEREFNSGSRGMDATVRDINSTRRSVLKKGVLRDSHAVAHTHAS